MSSEKGWYRFFVKDLSAFWTASTGPVLPCQALASLHFLDKSRRWHFKWTTESGLGWDFLRTHCKSRAEAKMLAEELRAKLVIFDCKDPGVGFQRWNTREAFPPYWTKKEIRLFLSEWKWWSQWLSEFAYRFRLWERDLHEISWLQSAAERAVVDQDWGGFEDILKYVDGMEELPKNASLEGDRMPQFSLGKTREDWVLNDKAHYLLNSVWRSSDYPPGSCEPYYGQPWMVRKSAVYVRSKGWMPKGMKES